MQGEPGESGVISGMRGDCDVKIYVDLAAAVADGLAFFESANGVVLCAGDQRGFLPPRYFRRAVHRKRGRIRNVCKAAMLLALAWAAAHLAEFAKQLLDKPIKPPASPCM